MPKKGYTEQEKEALKEYLKGGTTTREIQKEYNVNRSKLSRMKKKHDTGELVLSETSETKTETTPKLPEKKMEKPKEKMPEKTKTVKVPELDEIIVYFRENRDKFPSLTEKTTFEKRITGRDKWIVDGVLRIMRKMVGE